MADPRPFLPVSQPNLETKNRKSKKTVVFSVCSGVFLVILALGLIVNYEHDGLFDNMNNVDGLQRQEQEIVKPETLRPVVSPGVSAGLSEKAMKLNGLAEFPWNNTMLSWQRTAFHFQPEQNWMNDPNGPLYYEGQYHFFYQYNPNAAVWGDIAWGHAMSTDMITWKHLPLAMVADQWYDQSGVWTGSATILPDGKIMMLYTGGTNESVQVQNLAYPEDLNDPRLLKWKKHSGNPVLVPPPGIDDQDFRDPSTAWRTSEGKWRITIGSKVDKTGIALVYDTTDFIHYEKLDHNLHSVPGTGMWECVDFYPVSKSNEDGLDTSTKGPEVKHVMKASRSDDKHDYYAIGTYDDTNATWVPDNPEIDVGIGIMYDYGNFYASKTFFDQNKKRRILWSWIGESDSELADVKKGWASLQGIPRTVLLDLKTGSNLLQWPVEEVESLRLRSQEFNNVEVKAGEVVPLDLEAATQLDIIAEFDIDKNASESLSESNLENFSCSNNGGADHRGALGPFGLMALADDTLTERTPIYFYVARDNNGELKTLFCIDQSRSSMANDVIKQIYGGFVPVLEGEKFRMRILVDHSIIESFAQGGRTTITTRVYPTRAIYGAAKLFLFNNAVEANVTASLKIYQMNSAFISPYTNE